ncbi:hypothetical protein A5725_21335 [Mycobacterium kubicae]|nr:hypothetical protein A5725_21335 [Mycobacterium kubicae]
MASCVLGSRLIIISAFASPVPVHDQWDAEALVLYSPYLKGTLSLGNLFAAHNEHRIFITRVLSLVHLELAGEWNPRLEMILNALILTALITWLTALLLPLVARRRSLLLSGFVAFVFAFPIDFENTLWGFQSQIYFSLLFGVAAIVAFTAARPFSLRWFAGLAAATLSYFSFATGVVTLIAAGLVVCSQLAMNTRTRSRREFGGVIVLGLLGTAVTIWAANGAHPKSNVWTVIQGVGIFAVLTIMALIPMVLFCKYKLADRPSVSDRAWVVIGLFALALFQLGMFAYGRGTAVAPRYLDVVLLAYPLGLVAVFTISDSLPARRSGWGAGQAAPIWVFIVVFVIGVAGYASILASTYWNAAANQQMSDVKAYLATGKVDYLKAKGPPNHGVVLTHPAPERQARALDDPDIRAILPAEIRPPGADNAGARHRLLLGGKLADATEMAVHAILTLGPAVLAIGFGLFFAVATAQSISARRRPTHDVMNSTNSLAGSP